MDSEKLLGEIEKQAAKHDRSIRVLFSSMLLGKRASSGIDPNRMDWLTQVDFPLEYPHLIPSGVMGWPHSRVMRTSFVEIPAVTFDFSPMKTSVFADQASFKDISMGMSSDYAIALEEGSTMVRIRPDLRGQGFLNSGPVWWFADRQDCGPLPG
ncbi:MAG: hypothetical protein R2787_12815 [Saprospiraceae bacterium]